jgi:lipoprotein NlpI
MVRNERSGNTPADVHGGSNVLLNSFALSGTDLMFSNFGAGMQLVTNRWGSTIDPSNSDVKKIWNWLYSIINATNTIINRSEASDVELNDSQKNEIQAEAKCLRAWAYRHLVNLWGGVPLNLEESLGSNIKTDWQRNSVDEVYNFMEQDLLFAEQYLPETNDPGKLVKAVASHYLAELYLTIDQPDKAKQKAESVVNNSKYSLIETRYGVNKDKPGTPFTDMFIDGNSNKHEGNTEALWVWQNESRYENISYVKNIMRRTFVTNYDKLKVDGVTALKVTVDRGGRGIQRIAQTQFMMNLYEKNDDRGSDYAWRWYYILDEGDKIPPGYSVGDTIKLSYKDSQEQEQIIEWPCIRKWDYALADNLTHGPQYNDQIYIRLAETYLLLAEAEFKLGNIDAAATAINKLRVRANASPISAADVSIDFILDERARELVTEEHRRYNLLRLDKWMERTKLYNPLAGPNITERDKLLPIPQDVIDANLDAEMTQNPGY